MGGHYLKLSRRSLVVYLFRPAGCPPTASCTMERRAFIHAAVRSALGDASCSHSHRGCISPRRLPSFVAATIATGLLITAPANTFGAALSDVTDGMLRTCEPARVSCVVSQHDTPPSFMAPFEYDTNRGAMELKRELRDTVLRDVRARLVREESNYLRFEIRRARAVDDVEFMFPVDDMLVHFRAEQRGGRFDFGANRARLRAMGVRLQLIPLYVQRNRELILGIIESPFDRFGPSAVDVDAIIERNGILARAMR